MDKNAIDSKTAGERNEKLVIGLLRREGYLSQAQICERTRLQSSTVSYIVGRLREKQLIIEKAGKSTKRGAKPTLIQINPAGQFIIGVEISPSFIFIGLFDFNAKLVDSIKVSLDSGHSVENVVGLVEVNIKGLLSKNEISTEKLIGIGVTLSGSISKEGVVLLSSPLGWKNVPLKNLLDDKFNCPVDIYTTKVRLLAEMNIAPHFSSKNIVYFNVANGVGCTVIMDGRLIHGSTNRCGEVGHVVIDPDGPVCGCGQKGCLEAYISGPAIAKTIKDDIAIGNVTVLSSSITEDDTPEEIAIKFKQAVRQNDGYALEVRDHIADIIAKSIATVINLYDPDVVILAGYVNELSTEYFINAIKEKFATDVYDESTRSIEITPARAGDEALITGVANAVLQKQFNI